MVCVLLIAAIFMLISNASLVNFLAVLASPFHAFCLNQIPSTAVSKPWISAIVCADRSGVTQTVSDLQTLGLIHLIVVSGAQIMLIEAALTRVAGPRAPRTYLIALLPAALLGYAALAGFTAPLLRALIHLALRRLSRGAKLFWRPAQISLLSGLLTLACAPTLLTSLSLQLGWLASLAFSAPVAKKRRSLFKHALLYVILFLPLLPLGVPHPLSILCNWLLAPLLSLILFPLSAATLIVHALAPACDFVWSLVTGGSEILVDAISPLDWHGTLPAWFGWAYLACLQLFFLFAKTPIWPES